MIPATLRELFKPKRIKSGTSSKLSAPKLLTNSIIRISKRFGTTFNNFLKKYKKLVRSFKSTENIHQHS
jgi:N-acetylmuramic acid 6-phosphate (MurNAc-6-P) etherase